MEQAWERAARTRAAPRGGPAGRGLVAKPAACCVGAFYLRMSRGTVTVAEASAVLPQASVTW